jgi:formiminotetrahydrofolate cyclodeaminase
MYKDKTVSEYLEELGSTKPVPGGGSAAALAGAIGAALLEKVANFTIGKEKYKAVEEEVKGILKTTEKLRGNFLKLCSDDAVAYKKLSDAFKQKQNVQESLKEAAAVPLEICKRVHEAIKLCGPLKEKGNVNLISDVGVARLILVAAFESALLNVEVNLKSIKDEAFIRRVQNILAPIKMEVK